MSKFWIENKIIDAGWLKIISGNDLKVLLKITRHYNKYGESFPSIRTMSADLNLSQNTISKSLDNLEKYGFLMITVKKQRYKLQYFFKKIAEFLIIDPNKLPKKLRAKEELKEEYIKEEIKDDIVKNSIGREQMYKVIREKYPDTYEKFIKKN